MKASKLIAIALGIAACAVRGDGDTNAVEIAEAQAGATSCTIYRLECYADDVNGERVFLVGADGVRRQVLLMSPEEYAELMERFEKIEAAFNSTDTLRKVRHGKITEKRIDETAHESVAVYEDGYEHREAMPVKRVRDTGKVSAKVTANETKPSGISARQWAFRKRLQELKTAKPKEVNVEHDAGTQTDSEVK